MKQKNNNLKKIIIYSMLSIVLLTTIAGAITINTIQTKLQDLQGITDITQTSPNTLQYTLDSKTSKLETVYNTTLNQNVIKTVVYVGEQTIKITILSSKRIKIEIINENLTSINDLDNAINPTILNNNTLLYNYTGNVEKIKTIKNITNNALIHAKKTYAGSLVYNKTTNYPNSKYKIMQESLIPIS